jgi:hypothetical protein
VSIKDGVGFRISKKGWAGLPELSMNVLFSRKIRRKEDPGRYMQDIDKWTGLS